MSLVYDVLLDEKFDLRIERGDLVVGESTLQNQALLLLTDKGDWRATPTVGVALTTYLLDDADPDELRQQVRKQLELDGMRVGRIDLVDGLPVIDASYE